MGTGKSVNKENKTLNENKEKDKKLERDYILENIIIEEKSIIIIDEVKRIQKKQIQYVKFNGENGTGFFCKINIKGKEMKQLFTNNYVLYENNINKKFKNQNYV